MGILEIVVSEDFDSGDEIIVIRIPRTDLLTVSLDKFDQMLVKECDGPDAKLSDRLLGLETLIRRIEEQRLRRK